MAIIYIVVGETGRYDDYRHWNAYSCRDKDVANKHADRAQIEANIILEKYEKTISEYKYGSAQHMKLLRSNPFDQNMQISYGDDPIEYHVEELEWGG